MKKLITIAFIFLLMPVLSAQAGDKIDSDRDGITDEIEINIYRTDPNSKDTDKDGFTDWEELNRGYTPLDARNLKLEQNDHDNDGLSDREELRFGTDLSKPDTDGDGFSDKDEISKGFDPLDAKNKKSIKRIEIDLEVQRLAMYQGRVRLNYFKVSTGKKTMPTPTGKFEIANKSLKAWSKKYGLWMPYWLGVRNQGFGIHELPYWPNGYREGSNHLGIAVSHGCIRLGIGDAEKLFKWAEVGTPLIIY